MTNRLNLFAVLSVVAWLGSLYAFFHSFLATPTDLAFVTGFVVEDIAQVILWVSGWAWVTYIQRGKTHLAAHILIACFASFLQAAVLSALLPWIFFVAGWPWPLVMDDLPKTMLICLAALLHLKWALNEGITRKVLFLWVIATASAVSLVLAHVWANNNDSSAISRLSYVPNIYPATLLSTPKHNIEDGLKDMWSRSWGDEPSKSSTPQHH